MIDSIKKACEISCSILKECIDNFDNFKTEKDVANFLKKKVKEKNLKNAFPPLIVSGNNFLKIHHISNNTKLKGFVILDFGVKVGGYCSDITRMVYKGKPNKEELELFNLVLEVYNKSLEDLKIGVDYCDVDLNARINFGKYKKYFKHSLGHGVGKKIHQNPKISVASEDVVSENDVITIEPGIYTKKFGVRIEDTILVNKNGNEILTSLNKELIILD
ncbi:MAG: hypothetical protein CMH62_02130 [Nanoarchaeota archaeon]|nr:hypothetical protein [Nanoarchaeota archaeon]